MTSSLLFLNCVLHTTQRMSAPAHFSFDSKAVLADDTANKQSASDVRVQEILEFL